MSIPMAIWILLAPALLPAADAGEFRAMADLPSLFEFLDGRLGGGRAGRGLNHQRLARCDTARRAFWAATRAASTIARTHPD